ncbi:MAG: protein-L-isoaspartate O-methyltransferase [Thermoplasmata archaeon]|nr:MAG: protein-L-isoaspartate O-methyltransferase [Thermoplasmata archaeon]
MEKERLIRHLMQSGYLTSDSVIDAMMEVPREIFVPESMRKYAYNDTPLEIGYGQTISAPHMVAIMSEALDLKRNSRVLEVGTGTGYHAAVTAKIVRDGHVYTVERIKELAEKAMANFEKLGIKNITVIVGDGSLGLPEYSPFDRIYATCAAPAVPPRLVEQLSNGGKMLVPVGGRICDLILVEKADGKITEKNLGGCSFVPMVGEGGYDG